LRQVENTVKIKKIDKYYIEKKIWDVLAPETTHEEKNKFLDSLSNYKQANRR